MNERASSIRANLDAIRARIDAAARAAGRPASDVTLVAVSKTFPSSDIRLAYAAGQRDFGENYAQELARKRAELADLPDLRWHFIGALQSNKAKLLVPGVQLVHAIDRESVASALSRRALAAGVTVEALIEVNVGGEASKAGLAPDEVEALLEIARSLEGLRVVGLMCIPPPGGVPEDSRPAFATLARIAARHPDFTQLSMGMSGDFEVAVTEGATLVRVGSAIFGDRRAEGP